MNNKCFWGLQLGGSASVYLPHTYNFAVIPYYNITPKLGVSVRRSDVSSGIMAYDYSKHDETVDEGVECSLFLRYAYNFKLTK